ncbi:MAG: SDR family oxidoreductase [Clostridiales Family XIII bacterium]|jgi:NAD(P)-dependent dehydrogenase (short-subunit alcohol dehydrogenase family)|nr:SDR family oxidoreductase [Clostridiales Family XIII bacterium]
MGRLDGKVAVITGVTSGIGLATARLFSKEGATVVMGARRSDRGEKLAAELVQAGGKALWVRTDVRIAGDCARLVERAAQEYGRIDILANIAGVNGMRPYRLHEISDETRDNIFKTDLYGIIDTCRAAIPHMLEQGGGSIVNVASVAGLVACPNDSLYSAVKGAVKMLSIGMAYDYGGDGIRVNCICPGLTRTEMGGGELEGSGFAERILASLPLHRFADPSEIANGILFLASDESSFCCGTVLTMDGGEVIA